MIATTNSALTKHEIYVNEIVFYSRKNISLLGFIHHGAKFLKTEFVITRKDLQMLLSQTKTGIEILWRIENLFVQPHEVPATINLLDLFGITQVFEANHIELDPSFYTVETKLPIPDEGHKLFFIERVIPFPSSPKAAL